MDCWNRDGRVERANSTTPQYKDMLAADDASHSTAASLKDTRTILLALARHLEPTALTRFMSVCLVELQTLERLTRWVLLTCGKG